MTTEDYFAYVREYQQRLGSALLLARAGLADPTEEEQEEMETLYTEKDPFEECAFVFQLESGEVPLVIWDEDKDAACPSDEDLLVPERTHA